MTATPVFLTGSLMRHVTVMSLTSSIGLMAVFAVDFVDMVFIAMLGNEALAAAVGYAATVLFFTNSINIGLAIAAGSLVARAIGAGQAQAAARHATTVAALGLAVGLVAPVLVLAGLPWVLGFLGAQGEIAQLATRYLWILLPSMPVMSLAMIAMAVLRAHGDARRSMLATLYGGVLNAVLDPILIFGVGLGLDGAALASVAARVTILITALLPALRVHAAFARPDPREITQGFRAALALAIPAVLTNIATPVGAAILTREIGRHGTEAVAAMAVIGRLTPLAFAVVFALSGAIGPIIGQNHGAGRPDRVRGAFDAAVIFTAAYVLAAAAILFLLRGPIADLFAAPGQTRALIYLFCGPLALASFFNGVIFVANASFNNLGHPGWSTAVNWGRHSLGTWPFVVAGGALGGAAGALIGQALGGVIFAALAWVLAVRLMRAPSGGPVDPFAGQSRWQALFARHR
jgi:putative MATE family efflux protein